MNTFRIIGKQAGQVLESSIEPGLTLAQHLYLAGAFSGRPLCSGAGRCGLCRVRFLARAPEPLPEEQGRISPERLDEGWRLACLRPPVPGSEVQAVLDPPGPDIPSLPIPCSDASLGIDLGTTSVQWRFNPGGPVGPVGQSGQRGPVGRVGPVGQLGQGGYVGHALSGSFHNPQLGAGSEVMSRLALARVPLGAARLRLAVVRAVARVLSGLPCLPTRICLAGNTCMTCLALGMDVSGLAAAPYRLDWPGGAVAGLDEGLPGVYIPPLLAPFVGGDVSAGLLALEFADPRPKPPYLLADLGTNGEFALVLPDASVLVASVPMGPALEGVGMTWGMLAGPGAAVAFDLTPGGLRPVLFDDGTGTSGPLRGVSGTGYLSLLARLRALNVVSEAGRFETGAVSPLAAKILAGLRRDGGEPCLDAGGAQLFASDVEALLKVKAAFNVAVKLLLAEAGLDFAGLSAVCLAGALGEHVRALDLETLGFFPPGGAGKVRCVGNTSLEGACLAAAGDEARRFLAELPGRTRLVDVVQTPGFQTMYLESMRFTHAG